MIRLIACFFILFLFIGCDNSRTYRQLADVDSLFNKNKEDSAYLMLKRININELEGEKEKAYYRLLSISIRFARDENNEDDIRNIDNCISYYEKTGDKRKLALAYSYKTAVKYYEGKEDSALVYLKKAETLERACNDPSLRNRIYVNLAYFSIIMKAYKQAFAYSYKALQNAIENDNSYWRCLAYNRIANCHYNLGNTDSTYYYMLKIVPYLDEVENKEDRAVFLTNIGNSLYDSGDFVRAEMYLKQAADLYDAPNIYINLAKVSYKLGKTEASDSFLIRGMKNADLEQKMEIMQFESEKAKDRGLYEKALDFQKKAKLLEDSIMYSLHTEHLLTTQHKYEVGVDAENNRATWIIVFGVVAALGIAFISVVVFHFSRINKIKRIMADSGRLIEEYSQKIKDAEALAVRDEHEINTLRRKISDLRDSRKQIIENGRMLYREIEEGGTVNLWSKSDFEKFIEYYRMEHPDTVKAFEDSYNRLTPQNTFYLILLDMGLDEKAAQRVMCSSSGAFRTMKSRIKSKAVASEKNKVL